MSIINIIMHPIRAYRRRKALKYFEQKLQSQLAEMEKQWNEQEELKLRSFPWEVERPQTLERIDALIDKYTLDLTQFDKQVQFLNQYLRYLRHRREVIFKEDPTLRVEKILFNRF